MGWTETLSIAIAALAVGLFCGWRGARAPDVTRGPRLIPWRMLMLLAGAVLALALAHMGGLLGLHPGS